MTTSRAYNAANQRSDLTYDAAGNLISDGSTTSTWDALGRLTQQGSTTNTYNGDGILVQRGSARYAIDTVAPLHQILSDGTSTYLYGAERLRAAGGAWYVHDALGSVRQTLTDAGAVLGSSEYSPWGTVQDRTGPEVPFGFTGELQTGGLVQLRARWYHPSQGTFTARDPFPGWIEQPQSLAPYTYVHNNPINATDPTGKYSSSLIEAMIQKHYEARYTMGVFQAEYPIYLASKQHLQQNPWTGRLEGIAPDDVDIGKIDIADIYRGIGSVYEIKNARNQEIGSLEIERYINIYNNLPAPKSPRTEPTPPQRLTEGRNFPGERWVQIGVNPYYPGQDIIARLGEPGVIIWRAVTNRLPIPILVNVKEQVNYRERRLRPALQPAPALAGVCSLFTFPGIPPLDPFKGNDLYGDDQETFWPQLVPSDPWLYPDERDTAAG